MLDKNMFWLCWKNSKASVIKGWFDTLEDAIKYYKSRSLSDQERMEIRNTDRSKVVYPGKEK